jgi:hypothetical protein
MGKLGECPLPFKKKVGKINPRPFNVKVET